LFDDCYISICEELNDINDELASHMINAEFDMSSQTDLHQNVDQLQQKPSSALLQQLQTSNISTVNQNTSYSSFKTNDVDEEDQGDDDDDEQEEGSSLSYSN